MIVFLFLCGYLRLRVAAADGAALFELCRRQELSPHRLRRCKDGTLSFYCTLRAAGRLRRAAAAAGLSLCEEKQGGLPCLFGRLLRRPGLLCGVVAAMALLPLGRCFLWNIEIGGLDTLQEAEIRAELAAAGLSRGVFLPLLDTEAVALTLREGDARIAYAAVNLHGTVASVQIREAVLPPTASAAPAHLVARCDGIVTLPLAFEGQCLVREGQVVRAGEPLVSGLIESEENGTRVTRAAGQILARTVKVYRVRVDFDYEEKRYTGERCTELSLLFFNLNRKVFKTTGKMGESCDIIEKVKWLPAGNGRSFPIGYAEKCFLAYEWVGARRTATEAYAEAERQLSELLAADSATRRMLSKTTETVADAEGITLICTVVAEEDIAVVSEFTLGVGSQP